MGGQFLQTHTKTARVCVRHGIGYGHVSDTAGYVSGTYRAAAATAPSAIAADGLCRRRHTALHLRRWPNTVTTNAPHALQCRRCCRAASSTVAAAELHRRRALGCASPPPTLTNSGVQAVARQGKRRRPGGGSGGGRGLPSTKSSGRGGQPVVAGNLVLPSAKSGRRRCSGMGGRPELSSTLKETGGCMSGGKNRIRPLRLAVHQLKQCCHESSKRPFRRGA
uniref:Uncharacterized protein n=1 Tax=Oryza glumipatula TaxID=40148 RepID=A0A0D9YTE2_9ORYZ